ncbi:MULTISPECIES: helix-turn-helix domain-containing protein [unclassified Pseudonocardia]|uniref:helix-turn-helix domain-containing protein n=1 Tax=unclassified Pseudonocardia TaxID=2619320 RepID=UPI000761E6E0|nr:MULTISPECIES: helix-turn-helix domain-containing protein [unclassified Pseudonocardia]
MDNDTGTAVVRRGLSTTDIEVAEEFVRRVYTGTSDLTITGATANFSFTQSALAAPGLSINRLQISVGTSNDSLAHTDDPLTVAHPVDGHFAYLRTDYPDVHADTGDAVLMPPSGPMHAVAGRLDVAALQLDRSAVAAHAEAMTGIAADDLVFDRLTPLTPALSSYWLATVTHVRDDVLANPWTAEEPVVLGQAFRTLATALLTTFPNTALARITDPEDSPAHPEASTATLREALDYLDSHADRPLGPVDITTLTGLPAGDIVDGLRQRHLRHPTELLWRARLRGVHRDLLEADPTSTQLAALAARWGFAHLGRFTVAYLRAFDETPEQTMRR